jgi:murein peptide amidase A
MNRASPLSAYQEVSTDELSAASAHNIWEPLDLLAEESSGLAKWRSFAVDGNVVPSYVFIGLRGESVPIRLALLGRLEPEDLVSTSAIIKLLVELDLSPLLAKDFALFSYPVANPVRASRRSPDFSTDFWTDTPDPTIRYFEHELAGNQLDGIIAAKGNEAISGFQIRVSSRIIATEVLWPALEIAQKFVPLATEPIQVFPQLQNNQHSLFSLGQSRPGPFSLMIRTPRHAPVENQISAIVFSVEQILQQYRTLVNYTNKL